ncbi:MAG: cation diffusion facilitator family transporter [Treponema sp.]|nr:cation diffusion facilitator family transporter [Treponema sp.]
MTENRSSLIKIASITALVGNLFLALLKIIAGLQAKSLAVLGDGIDSSMDALVSVMTLIVSTVIVKPADKSHPWGHGRAETVVTTLISTILFFVGGQLILSSVQRLITGETIDVPGGLALVATIISIVINILLAWSQYLFGKRAGSAMLKANAKKMAADVLTSVGVLVGLGFSIFFNIGAIELATAALVGLWVIKNAVGIFMEANNELMDGAAADESYQLLFETVRSVPGVENPHRTRMRRIAAFWDIDLDIEVDPLLTVKEAHDIASKVENAVKSRIDNVFDIMVHVEPAGNKQTESYGLTEEQFNLH